MNTKRKGCLVVPYWQPGANHATFNKVKFEEEVCIPILDIFTSGGHSIDMVLVVVRCTSKNEESHEVEVGQWVNFPGEGVPEHVTTPTSEAVIKNLWSLREKGRVSVFNVAGVRSDDEAIDRAVRFARSDGFECVIIPPCAPIPADVDSIGELLRTAMSTACPIQYHVPYPQTVAGPVC